MLSSLCNYLSLSRSPYLKVARIFLTNIFLFHVSSRNPRVLRVLSSYIRLIYYQ